MVRFDFLFRFFCSIFFSTARLGDEEDKKGKSKCGLNFLMVKFCREISLSMRLVYIKDMMLVPLMTPKEQEIKTYFIWLEKNEEK